MFGIEGEERENERKSMSSRFYDAAASEHRTTSEGERLTVSSEQENVHVSQELVDRQSCFLLISISLEQRTEQIIVLRSTRLLQPPLRDHVSQRSLQFVKAQRNVARILER